MLHVIQSLPNWDKLTNEQILEALQQITGTTTDSQLYTYAGVIDKIGMEAGFAFRATVRTLADVSNPTGLPTAMFEAINFAHERFAGGGIDLSRQDVQSLLDSMMMIPNLAPFVPAVKAIGLQTTYPYASTTLEDVASALRIHTKQEWIRRFNEAVNQIDSSEHQEGLDAIAALVTEIK